MRLLVTAGPTRETIDPVRFLTNRSTGKMGFAVAEAGASAGHDTTLIAGPVALPTPAGVRRVDVESAADMCEAVLRDFDACDVLIMAAAVADWRPQQVADQKMKKHPGAWDLTLVRTPDILEQVKPRKGSRIIIGFAAETEHLVREAKRKRIAKGMDLIVANDITEPGSGFAADTNRVAVIAADDLPVWWPRASKQDVALRLVATAAALWVRTRKQG